MLTVITFKNVCFTIMPFAAARKQTSVIVLRDSIRSLVGSINVCIYALENHMYVLPAEFWWNNGFERNTSGWSSP